MVGLMAIWAPYNMGSPPPVNLNQKNTTSNEAQFLPSKMPFNPQKFSKIRVPNHENLNQKKNTTSNEAQFLPSEMPVDPQKFSKIRYKLNIPEISEIPHIPHISLLPPLNPPYCHHPYVWCVGGRSITLERIR